MWKTLVYPKLLPEWNKYELNEVGEIRNIVTGHILKPQKLRSGYYSVRVKNGDSKLHIIIHKAMGYTYLDNPLNLPEINHKDGNKLNNQIENLEWVSSSRNQHHKYNTGLLDKKKISGENNHAAKLTWEDIGCIRETYIPFSRIYGAKALARRYNVSKTTILSILHGDAWKHN